MSVFYKWIKGIDKQASMSESQWSYITWGTGINNSTSWTATSAENYPKVSMMPKLHITYGRKEKDNGKFDVDLGYFLTSKMAKPLIQTDFRTDKQFSFIVDCKLDTNKVAGIEDKDLSDLEISHTKLQQTSENMFEIIGSSNKKTNPSKIHIDCTEFFVNKENKEKSYCVFKVSDYTKRFTTGVNIDGRLTISNPNNGTVSTQMLDVQGPTTLSSAKIGETRLGVSGDSCTAHFPVFSDSATTTFYTTLKVDNKPIHALYFNAISDKRAKENIKLSSYSAIDLIQKLPVYNYNYKNNQEKMTGILAQDLLNAQPDDLDLVSNIDASGKDGDYMSIKNDKLMFVLLKAIQEQQELIIKLENRIQQLENK